VTEDLRQLPARLESVREQVRAACRRAQRPAESVRLVAVSKRKPAALIRAAYALGQRDFGENYAQELRDKADELADLDALRWHFIGPLQRNKVRLIVGRTTCLHTVADLGLIAALERRAGRDGVQQEVLVQLELAGETSKSGAHLGSLPALLEALRRCAHVECRGLMTMPPPAADPQQVAPFFQRCAELLRDHAPAEEPGFIELSMGMSHDLEVAIACGATLVRVGSAIFGERS